jgi:hypothetical protein
MKKFFGRLYCRRSRENAIDICAMVAISTGAVA